ncbi:MAG: nucleotidyl transferase AbiEii/AbiGii toxin family protein, partial [Spirochaetia bacterium]|nr:nucleotidyl transferase AbiEii/AbiGii toxin family protein [Spirochaetia bacterium]
MTFLDNKLPTTTRRIRSIVAELSKDEAETHIACISPIETAADKISALTWRVAIRDRLSKKDDPTIIRHLHDLSALKEVISEHTKDFIFCALQS